MKAKLNRENCIGCGLCGNICPEVFRMAEDGYAKVIRESVPKEAERSSVEACDVCPVGTILIEK
jgi:ferredoxin